MAYAFDLGFRLAGEAIVPLQQEHADMCESLGPSSCQIVQMTRSGESTLSVVIRWWPSSSASSFPRKKRSTPASRIVATGHL